MPHTAVVAATVCTSVNFNEIGAGWTSAQYDRFLFFRRDWKVAICQRIIGRMDLRFNISAGCFCRKVWVLFGFNVSRYGKYLRRG